MHIQMQRSCHLGTTQQTTVGMDQRVRTALLGHMPCTVVEVRAVALHQGEGRALRSPLEAWVAAILGRDQQLHWYEHDLSSGRERVPFPGVSLP